MDIYFLSLQEVIFLHKKIMERYGNGSMLIRDLSLLESAVAQPQATAFGNYLHNDLFEMASAYAFHIIKNHPFIDGNKRTGLLIALTFLMRNGVEITTSSKDLYDFALDIASSKINKEEIASFFNKHSKLIGN